MGWQSSNPGGTYTQVFESTAVQNYYSLKYTVYIARLTNNNVSVKVVGTPMGKGSTSQGPYYPAYQYFNTGSDSVFMAGENSNTKYWTGTLNAGAKRTFNLGYSNSKPTMDGVVFFTPQVTGPAYTTQYTITYNGNGNNSGSTASKTVTYGGSTTVSSNGYTKSGYTFVKWNTSANGGGTDYYPGGSITVYGNVTLYAIWSQITYPVTYNGNGADGGSTAAQTKVWGTPLPLSANGFTRTNYTFLYWNTAEDGSGTTYNAGASYTTNASLTLYAIWKKNNIPVFIRDGNDIIQVEKAFMRVGNDIVECTVYQRIGNDIIVYQ